MVQHLNVPQQNLSKDGKPTTGSLFGKIQGSWRRVKWMLITLLVPEFLVGKALQDWAVARQTCKEMQDFATEGSVIRTMMHSFYVNIGGVALKVIRRQDQTKSPQKNFEV
jgi:hypothetical protein